MENTLTHCNFRFPQVWFTLVALYNINPTPSPSLYSSTSFTQTLSVSLAPKMSETWRIRCSTSFLHRKSTSTRPIFDDTLDPDLFDDVFGGPPSTIPARKSSAVDFNMNFSGPRSSDVFGVGREVFERSHGFYDDIFGSDKDMRSKTKVKVNSNSPSSSSSMLIMRPSTSEDVFLANCSSQLRPINIPSQRNISSTVLEEQQNIHGSSNVLQWLRPPLATESHFLQTNFTKNHKSYPFKFSWSNSSGAESITMELNSSCSLKAPVEDKHTDSPSSMGFSHCYRELENKSKFQDKSWQEEDEDDTLSPFAIEINCEKWKEIDDQTSLAINEAIAWAKEKSQK